jgi:hypothetical protein
MAWVLRPSGLIKMEESASAFKVENVSWKRILIIDLKCYRISPDVGGQVSECMLGALAIS